MHDLDFDHEHELALDDTARIAIAEAIWEQDNIDLLTVGIDIGSSTTHLLFARVILQREQHSLSSRFVVVQRDITWRSPIMLTPFRSDGTIDAHELRHFFGHCYEAAGYTRDRVDSGAVILTGEAIKKTNARAIDEIFAAEAGKFVCATAGHRLEATLAAHGSGATALSRRRDGCGLHVDIGGGTTKLAVVNKGEVSSVSAFAVGGRLLARDEDGTWTRIDAAARLTAEDLGLEATPASFECEETRQALTRRLAAEVVDQIMGTELDRLGRALELTAPLDRSLTPQYVTFSGGVSEYIFGQENQDHGDIARLLAGEVVKQLRSRSSIAIVDAGQRIRATVIGASQFTVQVSGNTLHISDKSMLPRHNVPVVHLGTIVDDEIDPAVLAADFRQTAARYDVDLDGVVALALAWRGFPEHDRLRAVARSIVMATAPHGHREAPLVLVIEGDVGGSLGRVLDEEGVPGLRLISIDGLALRDLDFVDLGEYTEPPGVVPVVIKSLLFS